MKTIEQHFCDWESNTFGYGYGTGEESVVSALKQFLSLCSKGQFSHMYDHRELEAALTPAVAWLLINVLIHDDKIEYGSSPRYGWLTPTGGRLKEFFAERTVEQLVGMTFEDLNRDMICMPTHCNCDDGKDCRYSNPFWTIRK